MYAAYLKEYKVYLSRAKFLIQSDSDNHPIALLFLLVYYAGLIKHLSMNQLYRKLELKLNKRYLTDWLFRFELDICDKFLYLVIDEFYDNIISYRPLLLKNVCDRETEQHIVMLELLFDPEELVLGLDILKYITVDFKYLANWSIQQDVIESLAAN